MKGRGKKSSCRERSASGDRRCLPETMPLDGHAFLLSQGWSGTGSGLRTGAISRPITPRQKRNLAGIGKDRGDDFPFWDQ
jgi:hypothetical protein